jgi:hypothetical protein
MAEKKATTKKAATAKAPAAVATAPKKATTSKKVAAPKAAPAKAEVVINAENVGFKAGDVYQALAAAGKALSVADIAKNANITKEEALLGLGWLFKEGKVKDADKLIVLA